MYIINLSPHNGCYPPLVSVPDNSSLPRGFAAFHADIAVFQEFCGFVELELNDGVVYKITPNIEAFTFWREQITLQQDSTNPTPEEQLRADVDLILAYIGAYEQEADSND